jgi:recombination protein RecT
MASKELVKKQETIAEFLNDPKRKAALKRVMPKVGLDPERIVTVALNAFSTTPKLLECSPLSLFRALIQCASLGLEPNTAIGQAYLVPFRNNKTNSTDVQLIIGYKGYLGLARRSGELQSISSQCVYEGDEFDFQLGTDEKLRHVPCGEIDTKKITHAYAVAHFKGGGYAFEVMTRKQLDAIRAGSKASSFGPWKDYFAQMCRKTVIRRLMNYLPLSIEDKDIQRAVAIDGQNEKGNQDLSEFNGVLDVDFEETPENETGEKKTSKLGEMADDAFKVECPNGFDPKSKEDCDKCEKREGCPAHDTK